MIQPFAAPSREVPRLDPPAAPREAAPESSFADLLGEPGREIEVLAAAETIAATPNAPLGIPSGESSVEAAALEKAVAERFNEHGFFGRAVPALGRAAEAGAPIASQPAALAAETDEAVLARLDTRASSGAAVLRRGPLAEAAGPAASLRPAPRGGASGAVSQAATRQPVPARGEGGEEAESARAAPSSGRNLLGAAAARAARSATRVAVSETERGLHVAAFAQALPEAERSRLRDEIAALLSRHGLRPGPIQIAARRVPQTSA